MNPVPSFKDLQVWRRGMNLVRRVYEITRTYPPDERFGLVAETRKSARSVPANVAEGKMRTGSKEFHRFISIALGSLGEVQTQLLIARDLEYVGASAIHGLEEEIEELGRMLRGLERALA